MSSNSSSKLGDQQNVGILYNLYSQGQGKSDKQGSKPTLSKSTLLSSLELTTPTLTLGQRGGSVSANAASNLAAITQISSQGKRGGGLPTDKGGGGPPDGKGHGEESVENNLSFPVIFPSGVTPLALRGAMNSLTLTDPYFVPGTRDDYYWFAQKNEGNTWQAYNEQATGAIAIDKVDVGDALESARIELGQFVRIELALFKDIGDPLISDDGQLAYHMEQIDGQGKTEVQGTRYTAASLQQTFASADDAFTQLGDSGLPIYRSDLATVYAPSQVKNLTIQKFEHDPVTGLDWNGDQWVGLGIGTKDYAASTAFGSELAVSGKVISGVSGKPFKFTDAGNYRITFEIEEGASIFLDAGTERYNVAGARGMVIVPDSSNHNGLIYLDIAVPSSVSGTEEVVLGTQDVFKTQFVELAPVS